MTSPQPASTPPPTYQPPPPPWPPAGTEPWSRSSTDRVVAGVCGGIGRRLGIDPVILRVVIVVLSFFAGAGIVLYAAAWLFMPLDRTNRSVLTEALGSTSGDRTRSVLTAVALVTVLVIAAIVALDGGFVPGFLIAAAVVAILLAFRRDEGTPGRPSYGPPPPYASQPPTGPAYVATPYGPTPYSPVQYAAPTSAATGPSPYPSTDASAEPTVVTDPSATAGSGTEPTLVTDTGSEPTTPIPAPEQGWAPTSTWQQSYYQPPPPPPPYDLSQLPTPPPPPPAPPRERSYLGVLTVSAMIAVLGVLGVIDGSGVVVPFTGYVVAALAVVAGGLVLGAWIGRSRGLIALGIVLGLAIGPAILVDSVAGADWRDWRNANDVRIAPQSATELAPMYDYGSGSIRMDLTDIDFDGASLATAVDMGAGEVIVTVPADVDVAVDGAVVAGDLTLFDHRSSGFDASESVTDLGADGEGGGRLVLSIDLGLGKVEVRRATS